MVRQVVPRTLGQAPRTAPDTVPRLYLSSAGAGWEGLQAHAYVEPDELEGWMTPSMHAVRLLVYRGSGMRIETRTANGPWSAVSVREGDLALRAGWGTPTEVRWKRLSDGDTRVRTLHLHLSRSLLEHTAEEATGCDPAHLSVMDQMGVQDPLLTQIGFTLWRELEQPSPAGKLYAQTAAQLLALHLVRHYTSAGSSFKETVRGRLTPQQVRRVTDFVRAHLSQDLDLDALARQTGFSLYHFARLFRQTTGESPHQFVLRQRIERAQYLLEAEDLSLAQIALAAGFTHQSHLTQHFKRRLGVTPSAYRRERSFPAHTEQIPDTIA